MRNVLNKMVKENYKQLRYDKDDNKDGSSTAS